MSIPKITFLQLKEELRAEIWPAREPESLRVPHDKLFIEALILIQQGVDCYKRNVTQIVPFCATYFQCGLTVFEVPRGTIRSIYTYERLDTACKGDANSPINWCSGVKYSRIEYHKLRHLMDKAVRCSCGNGFGFNWLATLPMSTCQKTLASAYPAPTDDDYCNFPELPLGFHFPQSSTDLNYRAKNGLWTMNNNLIYIAPWIQSTETIVVRYDGLKRAWTDNDLVEDDPLFKQAVKHYVMMCNYRDYEIDPQKEAQQHRALYGDDRTPGAMEMLQHQCREESRQLTEEEEDTPSRGTDVTLMEQSTATIVCTTTPCPDITAPSALNGSEAGGTFTLNWTPGNGDLGQEIWVSVNGDPYALISTVAFDAITIDLSWAAYNPGDTICYKIRGQNACGYSEYSEPLCQVFAA